MNNKFNEVVIICGLRTPIGAYKGSLKNLRSDQLGSIVINEVIKDKFEKNEIDEVIMGQVLTAGGGQNQQTSCNRRWDTIFKASSYD